MQCRSRRSNDRMNENNRTDQRSEGHANKVPNYLGEMYSFIRLSLHNNSCKYLTHSTVSFMCIIRDECENVANSYSVKNVDRRLLLKKMWSLSMVKNIGVHL
jgi:hypothetical protein